MLTNKRLQNFVIHATDGELGYVHEIYFDDETWAIRYLTVDTGGWLAGRRRTAEDGGLLTGRGYRLIPSFLPRTFAAFSVSFSVPCSILM